MVLSQTEAIVGLIASVIAILTGLILATRYIARRIDTKFDRWTNAVIANSSVMVNLTERIVRLEGQLEGITRVQGIQK